MASQKTNIIPIQSIATLAVRLGRELGERISQMRDTPIEDISRPRLGAMLRRLQAGEVTDGQDLTTLEALQAGLAERLSQEIIGSRVEPRLIGCDQDGEIWDMTEVPVYSGRGDEASDAYDRLKRFLEVRQELLDSANAERLAYRLLR